MAIDLKNLSPKELQALIAGANAQMQEARRNMVLDVRKKIDALLKLSSLTLGEVYPTRGTKGSKSAKSVVAPKYRNPDNAAQTWSGRGKRPLWFNEALKKRGVTAESLLIQGTKAAPTKASKGTNAAKKASAKKTRAKK